MQTNRVIKSVPMSKNPKQANQTHQWVIGIGASAGGLEALTQFASALPTDFSHPVIIAQHLAPHVKSMMVELLSRHSRLPVVACKDRENIRPGVIYITPPNFDVDLVDGHIQLTLAGKETRPKPSIDSFFQSLALAYGRRSIGIILSGTGSDGSEGIRAIRAAGGITLAQDDHTAKYDGMPKSAVDTGSVDSVLSPEAMAKSLPEFMKEHEARIKYRTVDEETLKPILDLLRKKIGTDFRQYKMSTIQRRMAKRMAALGVDSVASFFELLKNSPAELSQLEQELLVSVTSFFRDPKAFEVAASEIEQIVGKKRSGEELRAWVAGCATGEEAYSVAMLMMDAADRQHKNLLVKVFATDLDHDAIFEARNGVYSEEALNAVPAQFRSKFFSEQAGMYEVSKRLREVVVFARQDLVQNPPFVKVDFVSCRNVLIYFEPALQKRILEIFHYALRPDGTLFLGKSEGVGPLVNLFETVDRSAKIYRRLDAPVRAFPVGRFSSYERGSAAAPYRRIPTGPSLSEQAFEKIFRARGLSGAVIEEEGTVVQLLGDVSPFLGFHTGQVENKLQNMLPKGVGVEIPVLLRRCMKDGKPCRSRTHRLTEGPKRDRSFTVAVRPLYETKGMDEAKRLYVATFDLLKVSKKEIQIETPPTDKDMPLRVAELEHELAVTREHLQTVIEELGISNEELQSLNEELSSTNEELQASSEELETTNEELQSTNEELTTLNEELNIKSGELRTLNSSLENVLASIGSPLIVIDQTMRVVRFNNEALKIFNFSPADIGRLLTRVSANAEFTDFESRLKSALDGGSMSESIVEVGTAIYQLRVMPCFDDNHSVVGAILIFLDNTAMIRARERLGTSDRRMRSIIDGSASLIFLKDTVGRYLMVNKEFCNFFKVNEADVIGKTDREILPESVANQLRDADLEVLLRRAPTRRQEIVEGPNGDRRSFLVSRFLLEDNDNEARLAVGSVAVDTTEQMRAQEELFKSEARYRAIIEEQAVYVCRYSFEGRLTFTNKLFESRFGAVVDSDFFRLVHPADQERVRQELSSISVEAPILQVEHRLSSGGDSPRWLRWICRAIFAQNKKNIVAEIQAVGFDVTDLRHKTDQLAEKDAIYNGIFSNTVDFLSVFRVEGRDIILESFNTSAEKGLGYISPRLVGRKLSELLSGTRAKTIIFHYEKCLTERRPQVFEESYDAFGTNRALLTTLVPILGEEEKIERIAAVSRDISDYKRIEADLRSAKEAAEVANKSKSDFLASMSHELRTPLNVVLGMSEILNETKLDKEQRSLVDSIGRSGRILLSLIDDVLDVAKIEAGKVRLQKVPFKVESVVNDVAEVFHQPIKNKGLDLVRECETGPTMVLGDPVRIRQVLTNMVGNAVKFTDNGRIEIRAQSKLENDFQIVKFTVIDTGIGIAEGDHPRLFKRFSQVQSGNARQYGGTGLGLTICKQLVNMMGGEIGFESELGKGSRFWFTVRLPISSLAPLKNVNVEPDLEPVTNLSILAVDDNFDSQNVLQLLLEKMGHEVTLASGGFEAMEKLENGRFDLVLMDIQMPGMDGYETTARIRKADGQLREIPIIALTANAMAGDAERCLQAGMDDYLTKPIHAAALRGALAKWAGKNAKKQRS